MLVLRRGISMKAIDEFDTSGLSEEKQARFFKMRDTMRFGRYYWGDGERRSKH